MPGQCSQSSFKTAAPAQDLGLDFRKSTRQSDLQCSNGSDNVGSDRLDSQSVSPSDEINDKARSDFKRKR